MIVLLALFLLAACGDDLPSQISQLTVQATAARPMNPDELAIFNSTESCMDFEGIKPPTIEYCVCSPAPCEPCVEDRPGWVGEYRADIDRISILPGHEGETGILQHECVHALLQHSTGDLDPTHRSAFFKTCASAEFISHP